MEKCGSSQISVKHLCILNQRITLKKGEIVQSQLLTQLTLDLELKS